MISDQNVSSEILCYGLSTCIHCKNARSFLENNHQDSTWVYVDLLDGKEREETLDEVRKFNPRISFPTIVIGEGEFVVIGFQPEELTRILGL